MFPLEGIIKANAVAYAAANGHRVTVCAYSQTHAYEVVNLVIWAKQELAKQPQSPKRDKLLATANTLLWED